MIFTNPGTPGQGPCAYQPKNRDVARPVANLGNTCYMNAVLQALAHAPELCMAMDVEPHCDKCPIYAENSLKRRSSPSSSPESSDMQPKPPGTRKSRRRSPTNLSSGHDDEYKFCALCEVEQHLNRVHANTNNRDKPVAPTMFVNGFINQVAPWFKLGQQEDSHEFLRLLIDSMQRSCKQARASPENPQDTPPEATPEDEEKRKSKEDVEYPFQLFRGTVESNVTCESCKSTSSTMDPIEDIGLDVTHSSSPGQLVDVSTALQRFARAEALDSGYKCEKCGLLGKATKQSRLSSIPPILTLHLKRFRYGETQKASLVSAGQSSRRSNRSSELNQLLGSTNGDLFAGKSGSAKIEGHSKFTPVFDLKPYLTAEMQEKHSSMYCRLFAVIVHAGKNSHSGHYISYVRNIAKNEWWKMDDARITVATTGEVMSAEAYMLFYRVVDHPFAIELKSQEKKLQDEYVLMQAAQQKMTQGKKAKQDDEVVAPAQMVVIEGRPKTPEPVSGSTSTAVPVSPNPPHTKGDGGSVSASSRNNGRSGHRKRKAPEFTCGEDWIKTRTNIADRYVAKFKDVESMISEYIEFKPEFFKLLTEQASKQNAKPGHGPSSGVCGT